MSIWALIFGAALVIFLGWISIFRPRIDGLAGQFVVALFGALAAGVFMVLLSGYLMVKYEVTLPRWGKLTAQGVGGGAAFLLVLVLGFRFLGRPQPEQQPEPPGQQAQSGDHSASAHAVLANKLLSDLKDAHERIGRLTTEKEFLREQLDAVVRRAEEAEKQGDRDAKRALEAYREKGDTAGLLALLITQRDRKRREGDPPSTDLLELNRQIAAVAFMRGDIATAEAALAEILETSPDDMFTIDLTGLIQQLRGELQEADAAFRRILELATDDSDAQ